MVNIYLTRHGQDEGNARGFLNGRKNTTLTSTGIKQALELAQNIKKLNIVFDKIYSSPLSRSYKTATIISNLCHFKNPKKNKLLIEREFGIMTGENTVDIERLCYPNILKTKTCTYFLNAERAESFPELLTRAKQFINFIKRKYKTGNVLLVTHGDIGKMIYASYNNIAWKKTLKLFHLGNAELILLSKKIEKEDDKIIKIKQRNL